MYIVLPAWIGVVVTLTRRATAGVSGCSIRQQRAYGAAVLTALVAVSVLQGVLKYHGVSHAIVYGISPPTAQLIVLGTIGAAIAAGPGPRGSRRVHPDTARPAQRAMTPIAKCI